MPTDGWSRRSTTGHGRRRCEDLGHRLAATVEDLLAVTGADKVDLVGHSLGGVVIAQALTDDRLAGCVDRVVTLGSPFGGTMWARLFPAGPMVWELRPGSPLLRRLAAAPPPADVTWLAFASTSDQIVPPDRAVPVNRDARLVTIEGAGHSGMLLAPDVIAQIVAETRARDVRPEPSHCVTRASTSIVPGRSTSIPPCNIRLCPRQRCSGRELADVE